MLLALTLSLGCAPAPSAEGEDSAPDTAPDTSGDSAPDSGPPPTCWEDSDGDGYGDPGAPYGSEGCPDEGYAENAEDCDDLDPGRYPGAPETCEDGVVQDCLDPGPAAGASCVWRGTYALEEASASWTGEEDRSYVGWSLAIGGDLDGDGASEVAIGAFAADAGGSYRGAVYLMSGGAEGATTVAAAGAVISGDQDSACAGIGLAAVSDLDGDGAPELAVGASGGGGSGTDDANGEAYLFLGGGLVGALSTADADVVISGTWDGDRAGYSLASGDVDGDGLPDLAVGAPGHDAFGSASGAVAVLLAEALEGAASTSDAALTVFGARSDANIGGSVALGGDLDGDGRADLLVLNSDRADVYAIAGDRCPGDVIASDDEADAVWYAGGTASGASVAFAFAGDVTGDGLDDAVLGNTGGAGQVWLVAGARQLPGGEADRVAEASWVGPDWTAGLGAAVAGAGDLDVDGRMDLALAAEGGDGAVYIVYASYDAGASTALDGAAVWIGAGGDGTASQALAGGADATGDGRSDLLVGNIAADGDRGAAWLLRGPGY